MTETEKKFNSEKKETVKAVKNKGKNIRNLDKIERVRKIIRCGKEYVKSCEAVMEKHKVLCDLKITLWEKEGGSEKEKKDYKKAEVDFKKAKNNLFKKMVKYREDKDLKDSFKKALKIPAFLREENNN